MTYLFDANTNANVVDSITITANVQNNNSVVSTSNPFPVTSTGGIVKLDLGSTGKSAFGELSTTSITPVIQLDSIYGLNNNDFIADAVGTGASANTDTFSNLFKVESGTSSNGDAVLLSRKFMKYRPGQGAITRFTAAFSNGVANSIQTAGFTDTESALCVGYDGTEFGILRATGGKVSIQSLIIGVAPNGTQTANITLDNVSFTVTLNAGTTSNAAIQISNRISGYSGWQVEQVDNQVIFRNNETKTTPGTFSFSSSGNATGTFTTVQAGVEQTEYWTKQCDWNVDCLGKANAVSNTMGPNPSGMTLRPDKLNVYQINFRWLGAGQISFGIEDEVTGEFKDFHHIHYTNKYNLPHLLNPSFRAGYSATNRGSTTNSIVTGASIMMGIEGILNITKTPQSVSTSVASLAKDDMHHILTLRNSHTFANKLNALSVTLKKLSFAFQCTDPVDIHIFVNALANTPLLFSSFPNGCAKKSTTTATFDSANIPSVAIFTVGVNGQNIISLSDLNISIPPGDSVSFAVSSPSVISKTNLSVVWEED